jgi:hypothetical protein
MAPELRGHRRLPLCSVSTKSEVGLTNPRGYNQAVSSSLRDRIKHFLKRFLAIGLTCLVSLTLVAYAIDYAVFHYRLSTNRQPYGQITVQSYDAVQQKSGKTQFIFNPPEAQTCVNSLFPHAGFTPCWYLQKHTEQRTDI